MQKKGKKFLAWLLMAGMLCSGNSVSAFAQDLSQNTDDMIQIIEEADDSYQMEEAESFGEAEVVEEDDDETVTDSGDDVAEEAAETVETTESGETNELFSDGTAEETDFSATAEIQQEETETVEVYFSVSHDNNYVSQGNRPASLTKLRVPYFDLALYGLENMYLAQGRDESGNLIPGTKETARNKVTMLHLFIYATEVLYCGVDEADAGKGYLKTQGILGSDVMRLTGKAGSIYFTQFWGMDQNLNYYLNYEYPLALPGLGATADQIVLGDEDVVTLGHFSDWGFYTDEKAGFNYLKIDTEITQAEADKARKDTISVEVYHAGAGDQYQTKQEKMTGEYELYYMPVNKLVSGQINTWNYLGTTDENGDLAVNLKDIPTGEYFVGVEGQPGSSTSAICSTPGGIYLTVTESVHECQWDEGIVTKKPTYTTTGVKTYTLSLIHI